MATDNQDRLKTLIDQALDLATEDRLAFLTEACCDEPGMLTEALELIGYDRPGEELRLEMPEPEKLLGTRIGSYTLIEEIGEGGMGVVYLAEQTDPISRRVALKIIKPGMDTREVITRFETERQALARMDHPNVARVLDAGTTPGGRPYFVMEHIEGERVTTYCERRELDLAARLDIFVQVCRGVNHAHQRGLIHRDLKPGNVLVAEVEGRPVPQVIDFGVAKAVREAPGNATQLTGLGRLVGTPEYMSPEQADPTNPDVDTRSDVYALGVLLHELLTGACPITREQLMPAGAEGLRARIERIDAPRPSTSSTLPWRRRLAGDLDWITVKALAKDRDRRYASAADLADDIERHLRNEPVEAGPPGISYRLGKFTRRHRAGVVTALLVLLALMAGTTGTTIGMFRASRAERTARAEAVRAEAGLLFQTARLDDVPWRRLAFATEALSQSDRPEYRRLVQQTLEAGPTLFGLPPSVGNGEAWTTEFSPDGRWLAVGWSQSGAIQLHDTRDGSIRRLRGLDGAVHALAFDPTSNLLAAGGADSMLGVWALPDTTANRVWRCDGLPCPFWTPDSSALITGVVAAGRPTEWLRLSLDGSPPVALGAAGPPRSAGMLVAYMDVSADGRHLVLPVEDRIEIWDLSDLAGGRRSIVGHHEAHAVSAVLSPDGQRLLTHDTAARAFLWRIRDGRGELLREFPPEPGLIHKRFDSTGRRVALSGSAGLRIWDLDQGEAAAPIRLRSHACIFGGTFSPNGRWVVTTGASDHFGAWSLTRKLPLDLILEAEGGAILSFAPDGRHLYSADARGRIRAWPMNEQLVGEPILVYDAAGAQYFSLCTDDSGRYLYGSICSGPGGSGTLTRFDLTEGGVEFWDGIGCRIVVDASGRYVASDAPRGSSVRVLDTQTGEVVELSGTDGHRTVHVAGFTRDGRLLAFGPGGIGLWNVEGGVEERLESIPAWAILASDRETMVLLERGTGRALIRRLGADPASDRIVPLDRSDLAVVVADSLARRVAAGRASGDLEIIDTIDGRNHVLPLFDGLNDYLAIDPLGRWIAASRDGVIRLTPSPVRSSLHDLATAELLDHVNSMTNLRVVRKEGGGYGWHLDPPLDWSGPPYD